MIVVSAQAQRDIQNALDGARTVFVRRAIVLEESISTQDAAREWAEVGAMVLALRQTGGRGRFGRGWADTMGKASTATFVLGGRAFDASFLSITAGLAAFRACRQTVGEARPRLGIKWPNDVVTRETPHRKVAGVLVERDGDRWLVGIGVNVLHTDADWPPGLRGRAVSIGALAPDAGASVVAVALRLALALDETLRASREEAAAAWNATDVLTGTRAAFRAGDERYEGTVLGIDPFNALRVRIDGGGVVELPALTTSVEKES